MKRLLLLILLSASTLEAGKEKPLGSLTMDMDPAVFYHNFWKTPAGKAFWQTYEGKTVLQIMLDYQLRMENRTQP